MTAFHQPSKILFISTFPPVKCGIASFTQDLVNAIRKDINKNIELSICALDKVNTEGFYDRRVSMIMDGYNLDSCMKAAEIINNDSAIELVCIEHEFGLYGGEMGGYLLGFLALLEKPFVIRFHTVLPAPDAKRLKIVQHIGLLSEKIIVMTGNSARLLKDDYLIAEDKMVIIPHGTHANSLISTGELKLKYNLKNNLVLSTFGLLSPNKGIEMGIMAMKDIRVKFPQAVYIVLGNTHPNLVANEGEKYRDYLQQIINEHDLQQNVRLVNEYVPTRTLMEYLALTDIYLFTSKDPDQAVSGTFQYAMSAGCAIISNSFVQAKEMLDEHTGIILQVGKEPELARNAIRLLQDDQLRQQMGHNAFLKTRNTAWKNIASEHTRLFCEIQGRPVVTTHLSAPVIS